MNDQEYMSRVRAMEGRLYRIAHAMLWRDADCADAIQEAVFKGWMKKAGLESPEYLETWLVRILINQCRDMLRRRKREPLPLITELSREDRLCEDLHLRMALKRLPEKYRLPLLLHHMEGYSVKDIASILNISERSATSRLYRGRRALRGLLEGGDDE